MVLPPSRSPYSASSGARSARTPVTLADGTTKPIGAVREGEAVLAWDEATGATGRYRVVATWAHDDPATTYLTIDGDRILATPAHPFATRERGWVPAGLLRVGEHIRKAGGGWGVVRAIRSEWDAGVRYNLTVAGAHTYAVGDGEWVVHNSCISPKTLSGRCTCMADLAVADQDSGQLDEAEIVGGLLVPADEQAAEAVAPAMRRLDHPAARRVAVGVAGRGQGLCSGRFGRDMRGVAAARRGLAAGGVIVAPVEAAVARRADLGGDRVDLRVEQRAQLLHVVPIGLADHDRQRDARAIGQQVPFGAGAPRRGRAAIRGVAPGRFRLAGPPVCRAGP